MIKKPDTFNVKANYKSKRDALKANKAWYSQMKQFYKSEYQNEIKDPSSSYSQQGHFFDQYLDNLKQLKKDFKLNKININNTYLSPKKALKIKQQQFTNNRDTFAKKLVELFTNKQVLGGVLFTILLLSLFHIISIITIPGITVPSKYDNSSDFTSMLNLLAGGGLTRMSLFAVGVGPYITAQIIVQLLSSDLIPALSRLNKQGERGKRKLEVITRILNLPLCLIQSYAVMAMILNLNSSGSSDTFQIFGHTSLGDLSAGEIISLMVIFTGGSYLTIFLGDMITKRGVGNGISVIILAGILSNLFGNFQAVLGAISSKVSPTQAGYVLSVVLLFIIYLIFYFLVLLVITFVNSCIRKIPVQQTGQGLTSETKNLPYLPIKLNSAGVIPVIFAWSGISIYAILIILFTFFYSYVQINPPQLAENFEKSGKFIPGVKTGIDTEKHVSKVLARVNWMGSIFLAVIASLPYIVSNITNIPSGIAIGGTGIIIIVSASIEIWNSIKSAATTTGYEITRNKIQANYYEESDTIKNPKVEELW